MSSKTTLYVTPCSDSIPIAIVSAWFSVIIVKLVKETRAPLLVLHACVASPFAIHSSSCECWFPFVVDTFGQAVFL